MPTDVLPGAASRRSRFPRRLNLLRGVGTQRHAALVRGSYDVLAQSHNLSVAHELVKELNTLAEGLRQHAARGEEARIAEPLARLEQEVDRMGKAWSGSNLGYQSRVYYADLKPPPPGAHWDSEWGFLGEFHGSTGDWREYDPDELKGLIFERAGNVELDDSETLAESAHAAWTDAQSEVVSILSAYLAQADDKLVEGLQAKAEGVRDLSGPQAVRGVVGPARQMIVRDTTALSQGWTAAPHQMVLARVIAVRSSFAACSDLARTAERAATHIARLMASQHSKGQGAAVAGENVFIGHGRSPLWRELKDFVSDRLSLRWDEFNRVPVAGVTNIARLSEMLDSAGIAFVVLIAEDETADGNERARQNVVHEAGLFQGRLGFSRAIVLLEEDCEGFSNIEGLGQIRFPRGNISASFDEVRQVLEREGFVES